MKLLLIAGQSLLSFAVFGAGIGVPPDGVMLNDADIVSIGRCVRNGDRYLFRVDRFLKGTNSAKDLLLSTSFSKLVFDAERFYASIEGRESVLVTRRVLQSSDIEFKPYWLQNSFWPQGHTILSESDEASLITKAYVSSAIGLLSQQNPTNAVGELLDMSSSDNPARALAVLAYLNSGKLEAIADGRVASKIRRVSFELIWLGSAGQNRAIRTGLLAGLDFVPSSLAIPFLLEEASQGSDSERRSVMVQMKERLRQEPTIGTKNADLESEERTRVLWQNRRLGIALRESELFLNDLADTDERVRKAADTGLARIFRNEVQGLSLNNAGISDRSNLWKIRIEQWRKKSPD